MATTFNPYPALQDQLIKGLDTIGSKLNTSSTVDDLANEIYNYIQPLYYPNASQALQIEIKSVVYNLINAYNNKALGVTVKYSDKQMQFVSYMLGLSTTNNTPINAIDRWLQNVENSISESGMTLESQTPLLLSVEMGKTMYAYWVSKINAPEKWAQFLQKPAQMDYVNVPNWTAAGIAGSLIGANATEKGLIAPTTDIVSVNIVSALIGALTIGAGKVIFKWVPDIQPRELNTDSQGILIGGFSDAIDITSSNELAKTKKNDGCQSNAHCSNVQCTNTCTNTGTCNGSK